MAASETGQSAHSYRWCSRPDYDRGSDAPWLARAPAWTRRDARHWSPTLAHCHPVQSRLRRPPPGYRESLCAAYCLHDEGDGGRLYPKKAAPQHRHTAHRTTHFPREDLAQRFLLCRGRLLIDIQGRSPITVPHLTRPRKGDHENRRAVARVVWPYVPSTTWKASAASQRPREGGAWTRHGQIRSQLHASKYSPLRCHGSCAIQLFLFSSNKVSC